MCQEYALPLQGRGGSTGYDSAVALPARSDSEELAKENNKSTQSLKGEAVFSVAKVRQPSFKMAAHAGPFAVGLFCPNAHMFLRAAWGTLQAGQQLTVSV